ncbi:hypothetical protein ONZ45_g1972 [Pleurotus djamor]|nr:hypothetical protein ONZ45_g1972 [Pleurotus djamor]
MAVLLSKSEKSFIQSGILQTPVHRADGRNLHDFRIVALETGVAPVSNGSARLTIGRQPHGGGGTEILAATKLEVEDVEDGGLDGGRFVCTVTCSPAAYPHLSSGALEDLQYDMTTILNQILSHPSLHPPNLGIIKGRKSWLLNLDLLVLSDAGNVFDALFMAAKAALWDTTVPRTKSIEYKPSQRKNLSPEKMDVDEDTSPSGLDTRHVPKAADFELHDYWDEGEELGERDSWPISITLNLVPPVSFLDASSQEEAATTARLLLVYTFKGSTAFLQGIRTLGVCELDGQLIKQCIKGTKIIDDEGNEVILRGAGLGGWMTMENFISGFPGCEYEIRGTLAATIGQEKAAFFFEKFLDYFFAEPDAQFFHSLGLNCIRVAVGYKHFEDDMNPRVLKPDGFRHLDRIADVCAKYGIYTVIDMHTAPGGQNGGWHSDHGSPQARFWIHKDFQDRLLWLWGEIALHYKGNAWIAGYNVLNEPADPHPKHERLLNFYDQAYKVIRTADNDHIVFFDGNTYATDFTKFPDDAGIRWPNSAFSIHDYSIYGFPKSPEPYARTEEQMAKMKSSYERKRAWMDARQLCVWNGEWGPVYARREYYGDETDAINERRYNVLEDQLEMYAKTTKDGLSWSIWLYKDIGFQGMVYVSPETPYRKLFSDFLAKKYRMATDSWGADDKYVKDIYQPLVDHIKEIRPDADTRRLYPPIWSLEERVARHTRQTLVAEFLTWEWAEVMKELDEAGLENLAQSFAFENCLQREGLNKALRKYAPKLH